MSENDKGGRVLASRPATRVAAADVRAEANPPQVVVREIAASRGRMDFCADLEEEGYLDLSLPDGGTVRVTASPGADPAMVAARRLVLAATAAGGLRKKVTARGGLTVVAVSAPEWLAAVATMWQTRFRAGGPPDDGELDPFRHLDRTWVVFRRDGTDRNHVPTRGNEVVADAAWRGRAVVGFATSPAQHLPRHLTRAPDCRIEIPPLDARTLRLTIAEVAGRPPRAKVPERAAALVTPDILRLARRPNQPADAYLARILEYVAEGLPAGRPGPDLDGIHGMDDAVAWGRRWIRDLAEYRAGRLPWSAMDPAVVLHGMPGTGKTMFAEALARSAGVPLVSASFARWQASGSGHLGDCLKAMRASFAEARQRAPCVLRLDEIDAIGSRNGDKAGYRDYWTAVVACILELTDGSEPLEGVLIVATTNDPDAIDPALLRSGRLDRMFEIRRPDGAALAGILRHHLGRDELPGLDLAGMARLALGGTGADCARWVRTARQVARQEGRPMAEADLADAIGCAALPGETERRVAIHEAGHAVVTSLLRPGAVTEARLATGTGNAGFVGASVDVRGTRYALHGAVLELLAGRAAEEVMLGSYSGGSGGSPRSDLALATCFAVSAETALGLGGFGPLWLGMPAPDTIGPILLQRPALAGRVQAYLEGCHAEAVVIVQTWQAAVAAVADALVARRSLTGREVEELVARHAPELAPEGRGP